MFLIASNGLCCFLCVGKILAQELDDGYNFARIDDLFDCIIRTKESTFCGCWLNKLTRLPPRLLVEDKSGGSGA